jgi:hypothetical protein
VEIPLLEKAKPLYQINSLKKGPLSVGAHLDAPTPWSHVYILMKSEKFSTTAVSQVLVRGVEFMVRRLVEVADPSAEATCCIERVALQVKAGELTDASEIPNALRSGIISRNPKRTTASGRLPAAPLPPAVSAALARLSTAERDAVRMYYVDSLDKKVICSRLSMTPGKLRGTLAALRSSCRSLPAAKSMDSTVAAV